jgi:hypothetical protein
LYCFLSGEVDVRWVPIGLAILLASIGEALLLALINLAAEGIYDAMLLGLGLRGLARMQGTAVGAAEGRGPRVPGRSISRAGASSSRGYLRGQAPADQLQERIGEQGDEGVAPRARSARSRSRRAKPPGR